MLGSGLMETRSGSSGAAGKETAETVRRRIMEEVRDGSLQPGERLGSERALAERFGVSRATLRLALDALERVGTIRRVPGRGGGTFVHHTKIERDLSSITGLPEYLRRSGYEAGTRVISASLRPADEATARELDIEAGAPVYDLLRVRLANSEPISLEHAALPADPIPGLLDQPLGGSIMDVLRSHYGIVPTQVVERIEVVLASRDEARFMGVEPGTPLLSVERTGSAGDLRFEYSVDLFRGDRTRIVTRTTGSTREVSHAEDGEAVEVHSA
jgi:GntR family transcriptional regulator